MTSCQVSTLPKKKKEGSHNTQSKKHSVKNVALLVTLEVWSAKRSKRVTHMLFEGVVSGTVQPYPVRTAGRRGGAPISRWRACLGRAHHRGSSMGETTPS